MPDHPLPAQRPARYDAALLLALRQSPTRLGQWVMARRRELFGREALIWSTEPAPETTAATAWPEPHDCAGARVLLCVEPEDGPRAQTYVEWLLALTQLEPEQLPRSVVPYSTRAAGTHRLWLIGAARLVLPAAVRVEARHDLVGIRLAQVALGFGADVLSGPIESERHLPVAGVTRPNEASRTGLRNLIEQAGLEPVQEDPA